MSSLTIQTAFLFGFLFILMILVKFAGTAGFKGWFGEKLVIEAGLKKLDPSLYGHYNDLYLPRPDGQGTTQIDHVVVSPFGIFVIETKNYKGWIFGSEKQRQWTQQIYRAKHRFQNPLHQNYLHIRALAQFLGVSEKSCRSLVFFIGDAEFKTPMPSNVINRGLLPWIKNHTEILIDPSAVSQANSVLTTLQLSTNRRKASRAHLRSIHARNA
jgi:restriction system protein